MRRRLVLLNPQWFGYGTLVRSVARNERYREPLQPVDRLTWLLIAAASLISLVGIIVSKLTVFSTPPWCPGPPLLHYELNFCSVLL